MNPYRKGKKINILEAKYPSLIYLRAYQILHKCILQLHNSHSKQSKVSTVESQQESQSFIENTQIQQKNSQLQSVNIWKQVKEYIVSVCQKQSNAFHCRKIKIQMFQKILETITIKINNMNNKCIRYHCKKILPIETVLQLFGILEQIRNQLKYYYDKLYYSDATANQIISSDQVKHNLIDKQFNDLIAKIKQLHHSQATNNNSHKNSNQQTVIQKIQNKIKQIADNERKEKQRKQYQRICSAKSRAQLTTATRPSTSRRSYFSKVKKYEGIGLDMDITDDRIHHMRTSQIGFKDENMKSLMNESERLNDSQQIKMKKSLKRSQTARRINAQTQNEKKNQMDITKLNLQHQEFKVKKIPSINVLRTDRGSLHSKSDIINKNMKRKDHKVMIQKLGGQSKVQQKITQRNLKRRIAEIITDQQHYYQIQLLTDKSQDQFYENMLNSKGSSSHRNSQSNKQILDNRQNDDVNQEIEVEIVEETDYEQNYKKYQKKNRPRTSIINSKIKKLSQSYRSKQSKQIRQSIIRNHSKLISSFQNSGITPANIQRSKKKKKTWKQIISVVNKPGSMTKNAVTKNKIKNKQNRVNTQSIQVHSKSKDNNKNEKLVVHVTKQQLEINQNNRLSDGSQTSKNQLKFRTRSNAFEKKPTYIREEMFIQSGCLKQIISDSKVNSDKLIRDLDQSIINKCRISLGDADQLKQHFQVSQKDNSKGIAQNYVLENVQNSVFFCEQEQLKKGQNKKMQQYLSKMKIAELVYTQPFNLDMESTETKKEKTLAFQRKNAFKDQSKLIKHHYFETNQPILQSFLVNQTYI